MSPRLLALIPLAVGINLALGKLASALALPIYLDTVGTVLVACLAGLVPALIAGAVSQVVMAMIDNPVWLAFLPVQLAIGAYAAMAARQGAFRSTGRALLFGLGLVLVSSSLSWPIAYYVFGGVTVSGVTMVTAFLTAMGLPLEWAVFFSSVGSDLLDKAVVFLVVRVVLAGLPRRMAARFPMVEQALGRT